MSTINAVSAGSSYETSTAKSALGKDEFLKLLVTQLKNQDPLNPMDGAEFTAQLAQFSSLEQLYNLNDQLATFNSSQLMMNNMKSVDLIGKEVKAEGNELYAEGDSVDISYSLEEAAVSGAIAISDSAGNVVKTIDIGAQEAGKHRVAWNCSDFDKGSYSFNVTAQNSQGDIVDYRTFMQGIVSGVIYKDDGVYLAVGNNEIPLESVSAVEESATENN